MKSLGRLTAALLLAIVVLGAALALSFENDQQLSGSLSSTIRNQSQSMASQALAIQTQNSTISSQSAVILRDRQTINGLQANLTSAESALRQDQAQVANLTALASSMTATISADQAKIAAINSAYSKANASVASLQSQQTTLNSEVASLQAQVSTLGGQISTLNATISTLKAQIAQELSILSLGLNTTELGMTSINMTAGENQVIATFVADYPGYVSVSMTQISNIGTTQVGLIDFFGSTVNTGPTSSEPIGPFYFSSIPDTVVLPVAPGSISVYLSNLGSVSENATISVTYFY